MGRSTGGSPRSPVRSRPPGRACGRSQGSRTPRPTDTAPDCTADPRGVRLRRSGRGLDARARRTRLASSPASGWTRGSSGWSRLTNARNSPGSRPAAERPNHAPAEWPTPRTGAPTTPRMNAALSPTQLAIAYGAWRSDSPRPRYDSEKRWKSRARSSRKVRSSSQVAGKPVSNTRPGRSPAPRRS